MADDSFYQNGAGTQHPDFGTQEEESAKPQVRDLTHERSDSGPLAWHLVHRLLAFANSSRYLFQMDWQTALRPVTIRQMHDAELPYAQADFKIGGKEVKNVYSQ